MQRSLILSAALGLSLACSPAQTELEPVGPQAADTYGVAGVRLTVEDATWPGFDAIRQEVTPVRVVIRNGGDDPIAVRYADFTVVSDNGQRYEALPPWQIDETATTLEHTIDEPHFTHSGFRVAPAYARMYPTMSTASGYPLPARAGGGYSYWTDIDLPTEEMLERALPEGVIEPGGFVDGYLFFEHVPATGRALTLRADLGGHGHAEEVSMWIPVEVDADS